MTTLIWLAGSSLIWGAILVCAVLALQSRFELSGNARQWIWRGAAMLLVLPWIAVPVVGAAAPGLSLTPVFEAIAATEVGAPMDAVVTSMPIEPADTEGLPEEQFHLVLPWIEMLTGALVAGWLARFALAQLAAARMRRLLRASSPAPEGEGRDALNAWARRLGLRRRPDLRMTAQEVSPFSSGALRPVICLPDGIDRRVRREALGLIVGHECIHVARGDGWWRPVERAVADLLWFNPFAWTIRRELDLARELACDEAVVAASDARRAYARTLRDVAGMVAGIPASAPAASMSLSGGSRLLAMRMKRTLAVARAPGHAAIAAAVVLAFAAAPVAIAQAVLIEAVQPDPPPPPAAPPVPEAVAAPAAPAAVPAPESAPEPPAVPAPAPAPAVPAVPAVPAAPAAPEIVTVGPGETLHIWFPARVVDVQDRTGQSRGFDVKLVQTEATDTAQACTAAISGLSSLSVSNGQTVPRGAAVGVMGENSPIAISCQSIKIATSGPTPSVIVAPRVGVDPATRTLKARPAAGVLVIPPSAPVPQTKPAPSVAPAPQQAPAPPASPEARMNERADRRTELVALDGRSVGRMQLRYDFNAAWVVDNQNILWRDNSRSHYLVTLKEPCRFRRSFTFHPQDPWELRANRTYEVRPGAGARCEVAKIEQVSDARANALRDALQRRVG